MISNIVWSIFEKVGRLAINVVVGIWIARELGPKDFGIYSYSLAFLSVFTVLSGVGLNGNTILASKIASLDKRTEKIKYLKIAACVSLFYSVISIGLSQLAARLIVGDKSEIINIITIMSLAFLFKPLEAFRIWYEVNGLNVVISQTTLLASICITIIRLYLLINGASLELLSYMVVLEGAVIGVAIYIHAKKTQIKEAKNVSYTVYEVKKYCINSLIIILVGVGIVFHSKIDQILLGNISNISQVGNYSAVARISEMLYFVPLAVMTVASPILMQQKKNIEKYYKITEALARLFLFISISYSIIMIILGDVLMRNIYGENYNIDKNLIIIYALAGPFVFMGVITNNHLIINGNYRRAVLNSYVCGLLIIVIGNYLYKYYGPVGVASSVLISQCLIYFIGDLMYKDTRDLFYLKLKSAKNILKIKEALQVFVKLKNGTL